jgi:hypothetical protein
MKRCPSCGCFCFNKTDSTPPIAEEYFIWHNGAYRHMTTFGFKMELNRDAVEPWQPKGLDEDIVETPKI